MKKQWQIQTPDPAIIRQLSNDINCHPVTAAILINRNITTGSAASAFLNTSLKQLRAPFSMRGMNTAVRRIHRALMKREKILIFGDYDADGVTATALLYEFLQSAGADVHYYVPHRVTEGYGLRSFHIERHVIPNRFNLVITVDCGSSSHNAVMAARDAGIDIIITDHHQIPEPPPDAVSVINPKRSDCTAGFEPLAGVGVVYLLLICLRKFLREAGHWVDRDEPNLKKGCDLVALGTVADIVPLVMENRIFTRTGLAVINTACRPGIKALLKEAAVRGPFATCEDIAFRLAPRINAAGRIGHAKEAVELLTTREADRAEKIAQTLNELNSRRRTIERQILQNAQEMLMGIQSLHTKPALVLSAENWHEGVLGIVASKLADRFYRPVVLISTKNGIGKGSARSIPGFDLYQGMLETSAYLEQFGGHAGAAGLTIKTEKISDFAMAFESVVRKTATKETFIPVISIDHEITFDQISDPLVDELMRMAPFGEGNPEPLFMARNLRVTHTQVLGGAHRRLCLMQPAARSNRHLPAIQFNPHDIHKPLETLQRIAFRLRWNHWRGKKSIQLLIEEMDSDTQ